MAGRSRSISRQAQRPRPRTPIDAVLEPERSRCLMLAEVIQALIMREQHDGTVPETLLRDVAKTLDIAPYHVAQYIQHFKEYHSYYPNQHPANAFTPLIIGKHAGKRSSTHKEQADTSTIPRRPHISGIDEPKRTEIITYSARIADLLDSQQLNHGRLPDGVIKKTAQELKKSIDWIERQMHHLAVYRATYGHEANFVDANAFTPLPRGRRKGRTVSKEIQDLIKHAALNTQWMSLNGDGTVSTIKYAPLGFQEIDSLVQTTHPNQISRSTSWRVFDEVRQKHTAKFMVARHGIGILQKLMPTKSNRTKGCWERMQLDVRTMPIVVHYGTIVCTLRLLVLVDDYSKYRTLWYILPAKRLDTNEEVVGQDYTNQHIRELIAVAMKQGGKRFEIIYPDNGSIFAKPALGPYMQFLTAPNEPPTRLINRRRRRPRGGGGIERLLGLVEGFLRFRPGYILEKHYRESLANHKNIKIPTYEMFLEDFDAYMHFVNHDSVDGQPSHYDLFVNGPQRGLTLPADENLALFALTTSYKRAPNPNGFHINGKQYIPIDTMLDMELTNLVAQAKKDPTIQIPIQVARFGSYEIVLFSLDNKMTWHRAIDKSQDSLTRERHVQRLRDIETEVLKAGNTAAEFLRPLLHSEQPIVLNGLRKRPTFQYLDEAQHDLSTARGHSSYRTMPVRLDDAINDHLTKTSPLSNSEDTKNGDRKELAAPPSHNKSSRKRVNKNTISPSSATNLGSSKAATTSPRSDVPHASDEEDIESFLEMLNRDIDMTGY